MMLERVVKTLTKQLVESGLSDRVLLDAQLARLVDGSVQRRHHLVSRAMKAGELIRLRRGVYILSSNYREHACHPFAFAQVMEPGSYVSLETALAFHGWIPEAVYTTASITPRAKTRRFESEVLGTYSFHPLAIRKGYFLELVERVQINNQAMLVATPIRALLDLGVILAVV